MTRRLFLRCVFVLCAVLAGTLANADERILAYHSDIQVEGDGSLLITETIRVRAEGTNIRRGLFRTFPTTYRDGAGNLFRVRFDVLGLTRDGRPEPWNAYGESNGVRVDFGNDEFLRVPAEYEYALRYRTNRSIGFFADYDELYWNVTGLDWDFPIDVASATVTLPVSVPAANIEMEGYTGPFRSSARNYTASVADGSGSIRTTMTLGPREGLTLSMVWPKGVIPEPTAVDRAGYVLEDNNSLLIALVTFALAFTWLYRAWRKVGRDPEAGVIFPHYDPPEGFSPAAARYVRKMGYDNEALTAAVVNLAVQGHVRIEQQEQKGILFDSPDKYVLHKDASMKPLSADEEALLASLFKGGQTLELKDKNHSRISGAMHAHASVLRKASKGRYYLNNTLYVLPSLLASGLAFLLMLAFTYPVPLAGFLFLAILVMHIVFGFLLRAPTLEGRKVMDKLEGFKLYLDVAEKDEMNQRNPPEMTPQLFERFLPFAIALGVEQAWAERFEQALQTMPEQVRSSYHPIWYTGAFNPGRMNDFTKNVGNSFNKAIASAATAPGTSSGHGGGGFSGGGGGGGGGGGR